MGNKEIELPIMGNLRSQVYEEVNKITAPDSVLGAIIGDIVGSIYEFNNIRTKDFELFGNDNHFTDDTVMTLAVYEAILDYVNNQHTVDQYIYNLRYNMFRYYDMYNDIKLALAYGNNFEKWLQKGSTPYYSYGNGAAMRVGGVALASTDFEAKYLGVLSASVTHNHPEGLKGAECVSCMIHSAKTSKKSDLVALAKKYYDIDKFKDFHDFDETCPITVPVALNCFLESTSFEDAIRNAIAVGGDSDTIAAITGSIAGAYYGIPKDFKVKMLDYLTDHMIKVLKK